MKIRLNLFAVLTVISFLLVSCMKENLSPQNVESNPEIETRTSDSDGPTIHTYTSDSENDSSDGDSESAFCCDVDWIGFTSPPFSSQAGFTWRFNRYEVPTASEYRRNYIIFRNQVLFYSGTIADEEDSTCSSFFTSLIWPDGLGKCAGVFSATMALEYRVGDTWYTCDADHGEVNYFPINSHFCE